MTGRATFGDFAHAASTQLAAGPAGLAGGVPAADRAERVHELIGRMSRLVTVMAHYASDIETTFVPPPKRRRQRLRGAWPRASSEAYDAIQNAAGYLTLAQRSAGQPGRWQAASRAHGGLSLNAAVVSLAAARDLLQSHFAVAPDRARTERSEWSSVVSSVPVARALLLQLGAWARLAAGQGAGVAVSGPPWRGAGDERRYLNAACQWLWVLDSAVRSAQRLEPVATADVWLLDAIPAIEPAPRRLPSGRETVAGLCQGAVLSAERVRHATHVAVPDAIFSPALTASSLSQTAGSATVISHNCDVLLRGLAERAAQQGAAGLSTRLLACAEAAAGARASWLRAARSWYRITTDTRDGTTPVAAEIADLALWTGRLAYRDPAWAPVLGPSQATRPPESLAPEPDDLPGVVAAAHQACETLSRIAATDYDQISMAARAGRLLVPTRSLPARFDIPQPFAPAPADRVDNLLTSYQEAGAASAQATAEVDAVAAEVRAPSHLLTLARAATHTGADPAATADGPQLAEAVETREFPGPVERILHDLGVTSPDMLGRAAAVDQASELLILEAAHAAIPQHPDSDADSWSRSVATAELINYALASGNPQAASLLRPPSPPPPRLATPGAHRTAASPRHVGHQEARSVPELEAEP